MSKMKDFAKCVNESEKDGRISIKCKLGLWSIEASDSDTVYIEAFHYWQQYADDGEYSSIIGGKSATDTLIEATIRAYSGDVPPSKPEDYIEVE